MKIALILLLSCASLSFAQDSSEPKPVVVKRLASITWNADTHKLVWVVQKGAQVNGAFVASSSDQFEVSPEEASMAFKDEKRGLAAEEQGAAEETKTTDTKRMAPSETPTRVGEPEQKAPPRMPETLVAANLGSGK